MVWLRKVVLLAAVILGVGLGAAGAADAAPALWVVRDADSEVYLFGTLHALSPDIRWRTPLYDRALGRADTVWFEADLQSGDPETIRLLVRRYGSDPDTPLSHKLAPADLAALARQADLARIEHLRPWAAALMLSMQPALGRGSTVEAGADMTATRAARAVAKRVRVFETLEDQARMFASLPEPSEVRYLNTVVRERAHPRRRLPLPPKPVSLEKAWLAGDLDRLGEGLAADRKANPALYEALLVRRNRAWADQLAGEMAGAGVELVNVGALHMLGRDGLPALLAARGYSVQRIQ